MSVARYTRPEMAAIWSPEAKYRIWFEIEAHACDALAELGVIPKDAAQAVWKAKDAEFDIARIDAIEAEVFWHSADLFKLDVDLVFYDATTAWFECDDEDVAPETWRGLTFEPLRKRGHSKEGRDNDPQVIIGQATIALEMFRQNHRPVDYLFVCVGGGGMAAGMALVSKYLHPGIKVIGVEAEESASMKAAFEAGGPVTLPEIGHFAEGVAVKRTGDLTYRICSQLLDEIITVDNDEICAAVQDVYEDTRAIAEPASVLAIAGLKSFFTDRKLEGKHLRIASATSRLTKRPNMSCSQARSCRPSAMWLNAAPASARM